MIFMNVILKNENEINQIKKNIDKSKSTNLFLKFNEKLIRLNAISKRKNDVKTRIIFTCQVRACTVHMELNLFEIYHFTLFIKGARPHRAGEHTGYLTSSRSSLFLFFFFPHAGFFNR